MNPGSVRALFSARNALVLEGPFGNVASAGRPDSVVPLRIIQALLDDRLQRRSAGNVAVERDLHPFRGAGFPFGVERIEGVAKSGPQDARRVARRQPPRA